MKTRPRPWYAAAGYEILDRNWRVREGELDLVARDSRTIVFCEVKTRRSDAFGLPAEAVTVAKATAAADAGRTLAGREPRRRRPSYRFDVAVGAPRRPGRLARRRAHRRFLMWDAGPRPDAAVRRASSRCASGGGPAARRAGSRPRGPRRAGSRGRSPGSGRSSRPGTAARGERRPARRRRRLSVQSCSEPTPVR